PTDFSTSYPPALTVYDRICLPSNSVLSEVYIGLGCFTLSVVPRVHQILSNRQGRQLRWWQKSSVSSKSNRWGDCLQNRSVQMSPCAKFSICFPCRRQSLEIARCLL